MEFALKQRGRALVDFEVTARQTASRLQLNVESDLKERGLSAEALPDDMNRRHAAINEALSDSALFQSRALLGEWCAKQHGLAAEAAFEEIAQEVIPELEALREGPSTLTVHEFDAPKYITDVWYHRTHGGWDGNEYTGFIHCEIVHKKYVDKVFPGSVYQNRRIVLRELPRTTYRHILDIGASSGHHTCAIAEVFPDAKVTGIDPSLRMLEHAQRRANENGWAWDLHVGMGENMHMFEDESFDCVTAYAIHHEMPPASIVAIFKEAFRVLEPGGDLIMADVARSYVMDKMTSWRFDYVAEWGGEPFWRSTTKLDMEPIMRDIGFVDVRGYHPFGDRDPYIVYGRKPG